MSSTQVVKRNNVSFEIENHKPSKDMLEALVEADKMVNNPKKYPRYNKREDLKKALLSDD